jgi:hypothetical protein
MFQEKASLEGGSIARNVPLTCIGGAPGTW